jgi:hypothetical protein
MVVLGGQNDYVIRRTCRRAQPVVGVIRIDQTLHIILCTFLCAPRCAADAAAQKSAFRCPDLMLPFDPQRLSRSAIV